MNTHDYIRNKQIQWAKNNDIQLIASKGDRGLPAYTPTLEQNLFQPLSPQTLADFKKGDGGELSGNPCKMQAVHSSSAIGVNFFQYWQTIHKPEIIAQACGFCNKTNTISQNIRFEAHYPIDDHFSISPNIDVVIENEPSAKNKVYAIECKFTEAYGNRSHSGMKEKYLKLDIWQNIPTLHKLAQTISPDDKQYQYLHPAQLIKHILGLKRAYGKNNFRLMYLWYDTLGYDGWQHRQEIEKFKQIAKADGIQFHATSYQELINKLANQHRQSHPDYIKYISSRYL